MSGVPVAGYPQVAGGKRIVCVTHYGPADYTAAVGDVLTARECGLKFIDGVFGAVGSGDQNALCVPQMDNTQRPPAFGGQTEVAMQWFELPDCGAVADHTNMSAVAVRLVVIGE